MTALDSNSRLWVRSQTWVPERLKMLADRNMDRMSTNQRERLARESQDKREYRLWMINSRRNERMAIESQGERENSLQSDRERHLSLPLLEQSSVKSKMLKFHQILGNLEIPMCSTCCKQFPGLKVNSQSEVSSLYIIVTSTYQSCTLQRTIWTLAVFHHSYR